MSKLVLIWPTGNLKDLSLGSNCTERYIQFLVAAFPFKLPVPLRDSCLKSTHLWGWLCESLQKKFFKLSLAVDGTLMEERVDSCSKANTDIKNASESVRMEQKRPAEADDVRA